MNPITVYQPSSVFQSVVAIIFYLLMVIFAFFSFLAIFNLVRFGKSRILALVVSLFYLIVAASLYASAVNSLNNIKF